MKTFQKLSSQSRRTFISKACAGCLLVTGSQWIPLNAGSEKGKIRAVLFDGFALFDPQPVVVLTEEIFPGKGREITELWRNRQLQYCWIRQAALQYRNFTDVTEDALHFATRKAGVSLSSSTRDRLMNAFMKMPLWPDVLPVLEFLKNENYQIGILANMTPAMMESNISASELNDFPLTVLSTDSIRSYKPSPQSYQMGVDALKLKKSDILFVASAAWDAAGAHWFGYSTYWVNRLSAPIEEFNLPPTAVEKDLKELKSFL